MSRIPSLAIVGVVVVALLGACVAAPPNPTSPTNSPAARVPYVGLFHVGTDHVPDSHWTLLDSLAERGYVDGETIRLDWRNLEDEDAALAAAQEWVANGADVIVAYEKETADSAMATTTEVPILFLHVPNPVAQGYVDSLAKPGRNLTGVVHFRDSFEKQIELFKEVMPSLDSLLVVSDSQDRNAAKALVEIFRATQRLGITLRARRASTRQAIDSIFAELEPGQVDGVFLASSTLQTNFSQAVIDHSLAHGLAYAAHRRYWAERGALFSYGVHYPDVGEIAARYVEAILGGTHPRDLPVEQIAQQDLVINLTTAKALGLDIPESVLDRADAVVE
jgi:putative tryptophan/tyrosine transport system substrate-binding protein